MHLFCFGYGYVAKFLSKKLLNLGWKVSGTSRNGKRLLSKLASGRQVLEAHGEENRSVLDIHEDLSTEATTQLPVEVEFRKKSNVQNVNIFHYDEVNKDIFESVTHVLISIPPDGDNVLEKYSSYLKNIKWLGYLSATSVYGDHSGNWVTEESETKPIESRGENRLKLEKEWLGSELPVHIFRLAGIYGPDRNVLIDLKLGKAKNIKKEGHLFSRIHVEDIANILLSSMQNIKPGEIYNCADDLPATQSEVITYAAKLLNINPPEPTEISCLSDFAQSFHLGSKKVSNDKIKQDLNVSLIYPNYKMGLESFQITPL